VSAGSPLLFTSHGRPGPYSLHTAASWFGRLRSSPIRHRIRFVRRAVPSDCKTFVSATEWNGFTGSYVDPQLGKVTFNSFYRDWSTRQVWESNTREKMDQSVRTVTFGDIARADLWPSHIEAWVKALQDQELQASTIRTRFVNVRGVIRAAVRDRLMARDVAERTRRPRQRKASAAMQIPTVEEVGAMLTDPWWVGTFVALCAFAGLRRGEAIALQVADVDALRITTTTLRPFSASPPPRPPAGRTRPLGGFGILQGLAWTQWVCSAMRSSETRTRALLAALVEGPLRELAVLMLTNSGQIIRWSLVRGYRLRMVRAVSSPCSFTCRRQAGRVETYC
jgi:hypothetical protein